VRELFGAAFVASVKEKNIVICFADFCAGLALSVSATKRRRYDHSARCGHPKTFFKFMQYFR
jgi:hypothetical protein